MRVVTRHTLLDCRLLQFANFGNQRELSDTALLAAAFAAVADNAVLLAYVTNQASVDCDGAGQCGGLCGPCVAKALRDQPHPGAALLERHREELAQARAEGVAAVESVVHEMAHEAERYDPAEYGAVASACREIEGVCRAMRSTDGVAMRTSAEGPPSP